MVGEGGSVVTVSRDSVTMVMVALVSTAAASGSVEERFGYAHVNILGEGG